MDKGKDIVDLRVSIVQLLAIQHVCMYVAKHSIVSIHCHIKGQVKGQMKLQPSNLSTGFTKVTHHMNNASRDLQKQAVAVYLQTLQVSTVPVVIWSSHKLHV